MDIQFISENSYSLVNYITKYVTKADKSHLSNDDFGIEDSIRRKLWKFAFSCLRTREMGAYEACDRWLVDRLYGCSDIFQFVSTVLPQFRTRIMKNFKDLENTSSESTEIFNKDLLSTYYPECPNDLENMPLKEFAATYERAYIPKNSDAESYCAKPNIIRLNGDNGIMKKRLKKALIYHHEFDPYVDPEKYYFSLLLLWKPWRNEIDFLQNCETYKDAFLQNINAVPNLRKYDELKQKIIKSKKKVQDEVSKQIEKIEEEGIEIQQEVEIDDGTALDQAMCDFESINNVDNISTEAQLDELVKTLNPDQHRIYDKIIKAVGHSVLHAIKHCECKSFKPLLLYVSGFGGTGKSYLIKTIMA